MKLDTEFLQLPLRFDPVRLADEVRQFSESEWRPHPEGHRGNSALPLLAINGDPDDINVRGPFRPTPFLKRCPYIRQIFASFQAPIGRARLMRIEGEADATPHVDTNYYWATHVRIHIPAITWPEVEFICGQRKIHMAAGEAWLFDTWRIHNSINPRTESRIHLVADTAGSEPFAQLLKQAHRPFAAMSPTDFQSRIVQFDAQAKPTIVLEDRNFPVVMPPRERRELIDFIISDAAAQRSNSAQTVSQLQSCLERNNGEWEKLWAQHEERESGWGAFQSLRQSLERELAAFEGRIRLANDCDAVEALRQLIQRPALNTDLAEIYRGMGVSPMSTVTHQPSANSWARRPCHDQQFDRPVIILAAPRSGSTLLFETLARSPDFWTVGGESHELIESIPELTPAAHQFHSNTLTAADAQRVEEQFFSALRARLQDRQGHPLREHITPVRVLEKTPKNSLRMEFLNELFPDALFIYLYRDPRENIASIIEAWQSGSFATYPGLPGWDGPPWSLLLIPGWKELRGRSIPEIAAAQWVAAHRAIMDGLEQIPSERWSAVRYTDLLAQTEEQVARLCRCVDVRPPEALPAKLPLSRHTLTPPAPDKWRRFEKQIEPLMPLLEPIHARAQEFFAQFSAHTDERELAAKRGRVPPAPLLQQRQSTMQLAPPRTPIALQERERGRSAANQRSVHTDSALKLLQELGVSIIATTGQANKLLITRVLNGALNMHLRDFNAPTGVTFSNGRLAMSTRQQVWTFCNQPDAARSLVPAGHDGCFVPRGSLVTGDIGCQELAWAGDELWVVNTRFSCLCTLNGTHSFVPRWRPSFISSLGPEDRCHLNGLAIGDGKPRFVSALAQTDSAEGWRKGKANGGCIIDISSGKVLLEGLALPHSPRWYRDRLWFVEAGAGTLNYFDAAAGKSVVVAELPGFTRGLDFIGPYAFVGVSQMREKEAFSGIKLADRLRPTETSCGIWIVNIESGAIAGFIRFETVVPEIFSTQILPLRMPDIISIGEDLLSHTFLLPDSALKEVGRPL
jgi:uncharacterized protein (TIGR03032 family)